MTPEELRRETLSGIDFIMSDGSTHKARELGTKLVAEIDAAGVTVSEGAFIASWIASTLLTTTWPDSQKILLMTAIGSTALHMHNTTPVGSTPTTGVVNTEAPT